MKKSNVSAKHLATLCGVSTNSIRNWCIKNNVSKQGKYFIFSEQTVREILKYYNVGIEERELEKLLSEPESVITSNTRDKDNISQVTQVDSSLIKIIESQLETLQEQLRVKDNQISELQSTVNKQQETISELVETNKALAAANAVQVAADKKTLLVEAEEVAKETDQVQESKEDEREPQKKRGFWARLFDF